jgi:peptidoglycan/xylan/chitin deacetylase (PgdA/CDA1 family)
VVPLESLLDAPPVAALRPRVAVSFDDAYRGALAHALPHLEAAGLPCTVFVAPALLGAGTTWWDALARSDGELEPGLREAALWKHRGRAPVIREWARSAGVRWREVADWAQPASETELVQAAARRGVTIGLHSWEHANLGALDAAEIESDTRRTVEWLAVRGIRPLPALAYPYGLHAPACATALAAAGVTAAFRVAGGWSGAADPPFARPRLNVPSGLSADGFALRLAGLLA